MSTDEVIDNDPTTPAVPEKGQGKDETVTISKAEFEGLRRERDEAQQGNRDWAAYVRRGPATPAEEPVREEDDSLDPDQFVDSDAGMGVDDDTPEKLVDEIAAQGTAAISKRGFITAAQAQKLAVSVAERVSRELIGRERQKITTDAQLMSEFPELRDPESDLFKATAVRYQRAVAMDPNAKKTPAALYLAADAARESLKARAPARRRDDSGDDDRGNREPEDDRRRRADSQDSRPRGRAAVDDADDMLGDEARAVIKGMGITETEFAASRKQVNGDRPRGRR